jgi:hypothetical protein
MVVHSPPGEVAPHLVAVRFEWDAKLDQGVVDPVELGTGDANRVGGTWVGATEDAKVPGDPPQTQIARSNAQLCLRIPQSIQGCGGDGDRVEHRTGCGDPGAGSGWGER